MENIQVIKHITPSICPHCKKDILVSFQMSIPTLATIFSPEENDKAKKELEKKLNEIQFNNPEEKTKIINWLKREETLIGPDDVEAVLKEIIIKQTKKETNK